MQEELKLIDLMIELIDARIPISGRNPDIQTLGSGKARLIVLNKADMADERTNRAWVEYFEAQETACILLDSRSKAGFRPVKPLIMEACKERIERNRRRGFKNRPVRAMIVGIPNVGKSTFINTLVGKASTKTGNRPGVTKGKQWIHIGKDLDLLDTPGILWPKFEDQSVGEALALTGSISQDVFDHGELSIRLIQMLNEMYPGILSSHFEIEAAGTEVEILDEIAKRRGCLGKGGTLLLEKASDILLEEFRNGKMGRFSLEQPSQIQNS